MTYQQAKADQLEVSVVMQMFKAKAYFPYSLPIYRTFPAPIDDVRYSIFINEYEKNDCNWEKTALAFQNEEFGEVIVFKTSWGKELYIPLQEFIRKNRIHISLHKD